MVKINLEIIDYIQESDLDENLKSFFINVIIYEIRNPNTMRFRANYNTMVEKAIKGD